MLLGSRSVRPVHFHIAAFLSLLALGVWSVCRHPSWWLFDWQDLEALLLEQKLGVFDRISLNWMQATQPRPDYCLQMPDPGNIAIAVKTVAIAAEERIPVLMSSVLRCAKNVKIYSDLEQDIGGWHLKDALKSIPERVTRNNTDFDFYRDLRDAVKHGDISALKDARDPRSPDTSAAQTLDKYKVLHILEDLYVQYPEMDFYLLMDDDTFVFWPNLIAMLRVYPAAWAPLYIGSAAQVDSRPFAQSSSGILLSNRAMRLVAAGGRAASWDSKMQEECCGDLVVGDILRRQDVELWNLQPMFSSDNLQSMASNEEMWCEPPITVPHVMPENMKIISDMAFASQAPDLLTRFRDVFETFIRQALQPRRDDWTCIHKDRVLNTSDYSECQLACKKDQACFQFSYHAGECSLSHRIHVGEAKAPSEGAAWESGWLIERITHSGLLHATCESVLGLDVD